MPLDTNFLERINRQSPLEQFFYNQHGNIYSYIYLYTNSAKSNLGLKVHYHKDSIEDITGFPLQPVLVPHNVNYKKFVKLTAIDIPKCQINMRLFNFNDKIIDSCIGCKDISDTIDIRQNYSLRIEYTDSSYHRYHHVWGPVINWDKKKFPNGFPTEWEYGPI